MFLRRYCSIGLVILLNLNVLCHGQRPFKMSSSNGIVAYPENEEEDPDKQNAQKKTPVYLANSCRPGEILYPGDQLDDWVCDCRPAYVYHPATQKCYPAHTRGPCRPGEYLILPKNSVVPQCEPNPCGKDDNNAYRDNFVPFRNKCFELDKAGPCALGSKIANVVGVNETTLNIICTKDYKLGRTNITSRLPVEEDDDLVTIILSIPDSPTPIVNGTVYTEKTCFAGGKRWILTKYPEQSIFDKFKFYCGYCQTNSNDSESDTENMKENMQVFVVPNSV